MVTAHHAPLTPDQARCHVLRVGVRAPSWRWDDLAGDGSAGWLAQPPLPFDVEVTEVPEPEGDDVPPELRRMASALARAITEVLSGQRPAVQLSRWLEEPPLRALAEAGRSYRRQQVTLASIRLQQTPRGSVEVTLRLLRGRGSSAVAYRLDQRRERWRCTALVIGP
jgi:hypothetical protein